MRIVAVLGGRARLAAAIDLAQAVMQGVDELLAALGIVQQVVLQVRVAAHDPDVAEHFVQHPGGAAGTAFSAQVAEQAPGVFAQQPADNLAVGKRRVVVGNFAQSRGCCGRHRPVQDVASEWGVHGGKRGP
ncbi:hypothetical protein G6F31_020411 [Rhizopus arrhizus]|nr:hypothetical protein G6F31_020411 [Rhizopus arrhizus]